jgi:hypothetical protein
MTENRVFKNLVRARMQITGESYTVARKSFQTKYSFGNTPKLENLFAERDYKVLEKDKNENGHYGLHLIIGVIGSGKTTTRNSILDYYMENPRRRRLVMLENTNEIGDEPLLNVVKLFIDTEEGKKFREENQAGPDKLRPFIREVLRMRTDYISYDEIRDGYEAYHLGQAANTGIGTFSTMHAMTEEHTVSRLITLAKQYGAEDGYPPELFRATLATITTMNMVRLGNDRLRFATTIPMTRESWDAAVEGQLTDWCIANGYESSTMKIERLLKEKVLEYGPHGLQAVVEK